MNTRCLRTTVILIIAIVAVTAACLIVSSLTKSETQDDMLKRLNINEIVFKNLPICDQVRVFSEVGSKFMDMDHQYVNAPRWMYSSIENSDVDSITSCVLMEINNNIEIIDHNPGLREESSLKITSLIYLTMSLDIIDRPEVSNILLVLICQKKVMYFENFIVDYYLLEYNQLPNNYSSTPEELDQLWRMLCEK
jgi:hypothetical protein